MAFDFPSAQLPQATPLRESFAHDDLEAELKALMLELFEQLAPDTFDASTLGAPHLGSFELVRRMVNHDGLVLLRGGHEEAATRYLYRAWKSGDIQKRGMHFLRTYLQLLMPNQVQVHQLWHDTRFPYGEAFRVNEPRATWFRFLSEPGLKIDGSWRLGQLTAAPGDPPPIYRPDVQWLFLTSHIEIVLDLESIADSAYLLPTRRRSVLGSILEVIRAIVPARLVPEFKFWLAFLLVVWVRLSYRSAMDKQVALHYPWCGRVLSESTDARWTLGRDPRFVRLPQPFGTFHVGERRGDPWTWMLHGCRIAGTLLGRLRGAGDVYDLIPAIGEPWRRLNGAWALGRRPANELLSAAALTQRVPLPVPVALSSTHHEHVRLDYPFTAPRIGRMLRLNDPWRLGTGQVLWQSYKPLDGSWALYSGQRLWAGKGPALNGSWALGRAPSIPVTASWLRRIAAPVTAGVERLLVNPQRVRVSDHHPWALGRFALALTGAPRPPARPALPLRLTGWPLGRPAAPAISQFVACRALAPVQASCQGRRMLSHRVALSLPGAPRPLGRQRTLDGRWRLDGGDALGLVRYAPQLAGWPLGRAPPIVVTHALSAAVGGAAVAAPARLARQYSRRLNRWPRRLDGLWPLGAAAHLGRFRLDGTTALKNRKIGQSQRLGAFTLNYDSDAGHAWPVFDEASSVRALPRLNGGWALGGPAATLEASLLIIHREPRSLHG